MSSAQSSKLTELLQYLKPHEREELNLILSDCTPIWVPTPGPQTEAQNSLADETFYGGAAGGGKTDLLIGLTLTEHIKSIIYRREGTQLVGIVDRITEIVGSRDGYNGQDKIWRMPDRQIELGACPYIGDDKKYQGRPHDLVGFDEITHFLESQYRFLCGWTRTTTQGQRCRVVATGNPPTDSDGEWVVDYWGPWLNPDHPNPARPGELRWYAVLDGKDTEVASGDVFTHEDEEITPRSRTFIPSSVEDNPFLLSTGYKATLQSMPEPLRSQMLRGDFRAGMGDDAFQTIPSSWVKEAQDRWTPEGRQGSMDSVGVDVARGGKDETAIAPRYGYWFDEIKCFPGSDTPDGPTVAALVVSVMKDAAPVHVDVIGVGASVYDHLVGNNINTVGVNGSEKSEAKDRTGKLSFVNKRAEHWWKLREALEPGHGNDLALPPGNELRADLCAPRWKLTPRGIQIESKEDLIKRIGRSPDRGDAVTYAMIKSPKFKTRKPSMQGVYLR